MTTMKSVVSVLCAFSIAQTAFANSDIVAYSKNGHSYQRIDTKETWQDAKDFCQKEGGYLATITSEDENRFVYDQLGKDNVNLWLGGTDRYTEGTWEWITGETWDYEHWAPNQPNDYGQGEDYLIFWGKHPTGWGDTGLPNHNSSFSFICEWNDDSNADDPISQAREEGRQQGRQECINNPASCGITVGSDKPHATYSLQNGELYIPFVDIPDIFGGITVYEAILRQQPSSLMFEVDLDSVKPR